MRDFARAWWARIFGSRDQGKAAPRVIVHRDWRGIELRFKTGTAQSRMSRWAPERLVVDYTRTMLGALLLLVEEPALTPAGRRELREVLEQIGRLLRTPQNRRGRA